MGHAPLTEPIPPLTDAPSGLEVAWTSSAEQAMQELWKHGRYPAGEEYGVVDLSAVELWLDAEGRSINTEYQQSLMRRIAALLLRRHCTVNQKAADDKRTGFNHFSPTFNLFRAGALAPKVVGEGASAGGERAENGFRFDDDLLTVLAKTLLANETTQLQLVTLWDGKYRGYSSKKQIFPHKYQ